MGQLLPINPLPCEQPFLSHCKGFLYELNLEDGMVKYEIDVKAIAYGFKSQHHLQQCDVEDLIQTIWLKLLQIQDDKRLIDYSFRRTVMLNAARNWFKQFCRISNRNVELKEYHAQTESNDSKILLDQIMYLMPSEQQTIFKLYYGLEGKKKTKRPQTIATLTGIKQSKVIELISDMFETLKSLT